MSKETLVQTLGVLIALATVAVTVASIIYEITHRL
jgi:hypothetical protein